MNWEDHAACHGSVAALFFAPDAEHELQRELREEAAKLICVGCPVRSRCLESAMGADIRYGLWGGLTEAERRIERRRRARRRRAVA